ncbi:hypothetical protein [Methanofollis sp.]|uniref:hypothetical protein n=1 Tax=Methanofollis sp. TaxID=2052835 RepID=UPI0026212C62|nr:hypothetical protein [Methanofollis sp.]
MFISKKRMLGGILSLLLIGALVMPAGAFTAEKLTIDVEEDGTATVTFDYSLTWLENIAVFLKITDPNVEFGKALEKYSGSEVESVAVSDRSASFRAEKFARVSLVDNATVYTTPALHLEEAEKALNDYWFAPLVQADFSPAVTEITFADGKVETLRDIAEIPSFIHQVPATP